MITIPGLGIVFLSSVKYWAILACFVAVMLIIPTRIYRGFFALGIVTLLLAAVLGIAAL
jgi:hypothetical protein